MTRYLSKEWKAEQWRAFEEEQIAGDTSDCGGGGGSGLCGGCARCMGMQFAHYLHNEEEQARVWLAAGFDVAPIGMVSIGYFPGFDGYHDSYNCRMTEERQQWRFPWED